MFKEVLLLYKGLNMPANTRPAKIQTTLYELIATLQEKTANDPRSDIIVVATVTTMINEGRIRYPKPYSHS